MKYIRFCSRTMEHLIDWVKCTFKMWRGEPRVKHTPMAWRSSLYEGCVAISTLWPYGLGCHMLGSCRTTCLGTNLIQNHASNEITSCPAPCPRRTGEDDSPKPSCNKSKELQRYQLVIINPWYRLFLLWSTSIHHITWYIQLVITSGETNNVDQSYSRSYSLLNDSCYHVTPLEVHP